MAAKILYVDDEDDIREIAKMSLELESRFSIRTCSSGATALEEAAEWQPDLILLDVMMPEMDGPETLRRLAEASHTSSIPVVFITARTQTHEVERYLAMGAVGIIAKPFDPMTLAGDVRKLLEAHQRERPG
ncbi:response regulator [Pseudaminobacter arsenicus]|uniref:Response regulator n=1 Tax=Borborobacter arsenicus TaxID=1851146 RepID=A0A432V0T8_9HYPH|nr:response regulator [Pseudaminobacter arsenicus]RUM95824.1 response regulator [Pseudaminobacter arsenicus]